MISFGPLMFFSFSVGLFHTGKLMPTKWRCEFTALIYFMSLTLWVLSAAVLRLLGLSWLFPTSTLLLLLASNRMQPHGKEWLSWAQCPQKCESCIIVGNKQGTYRCLSLQCFFLTHVPLLSLLILFSFTGTHIASVSDQFFQWKAFILFQAVL